MDLVDVMLIAGGGIDNESLEDVMRRTTMARIVDTRMMNIHLAAARKQLELAKGHRKAWKERKIEVGKFFFNDALKQAEEQVLMAELYINEED